MHKPLQLRNIAYQQNGMGYYKRKPIVTSYLAFM